jgi:hypothetical protein
MMDADDDTMRECQNSGSSTIFVDSIRPFGLGI